VDNLDQKLNVAVDAPAEIRPTTSLGAGVRVTDLSGTPVANAAVTLAAVDEGICALTGFKTPDPFAYFTRNRALGVEMADLFGQLMPELAKPDKSSAVGGDKDAYDPRHASPVSAKRVKPVLDVAIARFKEVQGLRAELAKTKASLGERKVIERAKGLLMQQRGLSEDDAFRALRKLAMDKNQRLVEVAQALLTYAQLLKP